MTEKDEFPLEKLKNFNLWNKLIEASTYEPNITKLLIG